MLLDVPIDRVAKKAEGRFPGLESGQGSPVIEDAFELLLEMKQLDCRRGVLLPGRREKPVAARFAVLADQMGLANPPPAVNGEELGGPRPEKIVENFLFGPSSDNGAIRTFRGFGHFFGR